MSIRKKYNLMLTINLFLVLLILIGVFCLLKNYLKEKNEIKENINENVEEKEKIKTDDNKDYIGIFEIIEEDSECFKKTTLVLSEDYSFIFYIGDCNIDSYYHGKYKIENKEIVLYEIKLQDTTILEELKVNEDISFHIIDVDTINSVFGRSDGIILKRKLNFV